MLTKVVSPHFGTKHDTELEQHNLKKKSSSSLMYLQPQFGKAYALLENI